MKKFLYLFILIILTLYLHTYNSSNNPSFEQNEPVPPSSSKIVALSHFSAEIPASSAPLLEWNKDLNAVYYELELFDTVPENLSNDDLSSDHLYYTASIYTNAYQIDLKDIAPEYLNKKPLYWRVRSMDIDGNPISSFSKLETLYATDAPSSMNSPLPHVTYNKENGTTLLYPVYAFIPNAHATQFEIEVTDRPPENPRGTAPSKYRIFSAITNLCDYYDPKARIGKYYWRVRGLDDDNNPVGVYSDAQTFENNPNDNWKIGIFGDSISHGGGHLSFGPADWEYSYAYYLDFPTINLSCSGDTSETMVKRFDTDVVPFHPQYLLIMGGTNSLRAGVPAENVIEDLIAIREKCYENNIKPIFLTLAPINPENIKKVFDEDTSPVWQRNLNIVNKFIRTQPHIDAAAALNSPAILPTYYGMDGLHGDIPTKKIYAQAINDNISQFIEK